VEALLAEKQADLARWIANNRTFADTFERAKTAGANASAPTLAK
jgi:hypothetical protein